MQTAQSVCLSLECCLVAPSFGIRTLAIARGHVEGFAQYDVHNQVAQTSVRRGGLARRVCLKRGWPVHRTNTWQVSAARAMQHSLLALALRPDRHCGDMVYHACGGPKPGCHDLAQARTTLIAGFEGR
jgi:hypothetical protein